MASLSCEVSSPSPRLTSMIVRRSGPARSRSRSIYATAQPLPLFLIEGSPLHTDDVVQMIGDRRVVRQGKEGRLVPLKHRFNRLAQEIVLDTDYAPGNTMVILCTAF
jgi:hypothetical protein